jgi:hypothetical protein
MEAMAELAKGALHYAPSYIATFVELLSGPISFLRKVLTSDNEEELKRAFSFAFLSILLAALLMTASSGLSDSPRVFMINIAIKILQVSLLTACMHFALRIVSIQISRPIVTALSLYFVSFGYLVLVVADFAGLKAKEPTAIEGILSLGYVALYWTSLRLALHLSWSKTIISFVVFLGLSVPTGYMLNRVVEGIERSQPVDHSRQDRGLKESSAQPKAD